MHLPRLLQRPLLAAWLALAGTAACAQAAGCPPAPPVLESLRADDLRRDVRDRGLLWRLDRDGRTSWLYGTMHVSRIEWLVPGPRVQEALSGSEVVALELDPADPELPRLFSAPGDAARNARVLRGLQPRVDKLASRACATPGRLEALRPILQLMMLSLFETRRDGFHPELAVDGVLYGMARGLGKRVVALESAAAQLAAIQPESEADEREMMARGLQDLASGEGRAVMLRLLAAWAAGDEQQFESYPQWCGCMDTPAERRYFRRLNDDRNPGIADRLAALHGEGQRVFAAVGALHMTGENALPALLRARGFTVQRVPFAATR